MQVIYGDASNINLTAQKRLLRVVEGQTQATPFAGIIDPSLRNTTGGIRVPLKTDEAGVTPAGGAAAAPFSRSGDAFTFEGSLVPGLVLVKTVGEAFAIGDAGVATGVYGLLGQWVGGTFDNIKQSNQISAWQGPDSVYDLIAPGFDSTELSTKVAENKEGKPVYLFVGKDGRLCVTEGTNKTKIAEVVDYSNPSVLRFKLLV
jgi:hypothetical protein